MEGSGSGTDSESRSLSIVEIDLELESLSGPVISSDKLCLLSQGENLLAFTGKLICDL